MPTVALYWLGQCLHLKHVVIPHVIHIVSLFGISEREWHAWISKPLHCHAWFSVVFSWWASSPPALCISWIHTNKLRHVEPYPSLQTQPTLIVSLSDLNKPVNTPFGQTLSNKPNASVQVPNKPPSLSTILKPTPIHAKPCPQPTWLSNPRWSTNKNCRG